MSNVYVFRINYGDKFKRIREEIICGRLRQGWGAEGMTIDASIEDFKTAWKAVWGENDADEKYMERKYNNLRIMKDFKEGDYIVIPKLDVTGGKDYPCKCFTVLECVEPYSFSVLNKGKENDFGHIIGVKTIFSCSYHNDKLNPITISGKFKGYQRSINFVKDNNFKEALQELIIINNKIPIMPDGEEKAYTFIMAQEISEQYDKIVTENLANLRKLDPKSFEYLIRELFEKNGYICSRMNSYDKEGGDIDIQMMLNEKSLLGSAFRQAKGNDNLYINIQAKKKDGMDWESRAAVDQLVNKRKTEKKDHYIDIVIDLTDGYDDDTQEYAEKNHVLLINGKQFSYILLQYGFTGEVDLLD